MTRSTALSIRNIALTFAAMLVAACADVAIGIGTAELGIRLGLLAIPILFAGVFTLALLVAAIAHQIAKRSAA